MSSIKVDREEQYNSLYNLASFLREFERFNELGHYLKVSIVDSFGCTHCWCFEDNCECEIDEDYDDDGEPYVNEDDPRIDR